MPRISSQVINRVTLKYLYTINFNLIFMYRISSIKRPPSFKRPPLISAHLILKCCK